MPNEKTLCTNLSSAVEKKLQYLSISTLMFQCLEELEKLDRDDFTGTDIDPLNNDRFGRVPDINAITSGLPVIIFTQGRHPTEVARDLMNAAAFIIDADYWDRLFGSLSVLSDSEVWIDYRPHLTETKMQEVMA